ncbi:unnamed protein product [Linum trigynum]|uniref:Uncharacterized protein n=1 Tax=Linum trigynum TaxID=586398 RepID=A0AAV2D2D7_9ROSI
MRPEKSIPRRERQRRGQIVADCSLRSQESLGFFLFSRGLGHLTTRASKPQLNLLSCGESYEVIAKVGDVREDWSYISCTT